MKRSWIILPQKPRKKPNINSKIKIICILWSLSDFWIGLEWLVSSCFCSVSTFFQPFSMNYKFLFCLEQILELFFSICYANILLSFLDLQPFQCLKNGHLKNHQPNKPCKDPQKFTFIVNTLFICVQHLWHH